MGLLGQDAEARLDVRHEGWRLSLLEWCYEPEGVLAMNRALEGLTLFEALGICHFFSSAPLAGPMAWQQMMMS